MNNEKLISLFDAPISTVRRKDGTVAVATVRPSKCLTLREIWDLITRDVNLVSLTTAVRLSMNMREAKASMLPYITPCGRFSYRRSNNLLEASGYVVVDVDHLDSQEEAEQMRDRLFADEYLHPALAFVSPSGRGVKVLVPYDTERLTDAARNAAENMVWAMQYVQMTYCPASAWSAKGVDVSGKDIVRACFLCHDSGALLRTDENETRVVMTEKSLF